MNGLVVEGGASRTYFAVGVMDALLEENVYFDYIGGSSAGIANAISYASGQKGRNIEIGIKHLPLKKYLGKRHFFNPFNRSPYNIKYVFDTIPNILCPFDYDAYDSYKGTVEAAITNVESGKCEYAPIVNPRKGWKEIVASCSLPLVFPVVKIGGKKYLDGGIADPVPFKRAMDCGCNKTLVILSRERDYIKDEGKGEQLSSMFFARHKNFARVLKNRSGLYNNQRREMFELEKKGALMIIAPDNTSGWERLENNPDKILQFYNEGYRKAKKNMKEIKNYLKD